MNVIEINVSKQMNGCTFSVGLNVRNLIKDRFPDAHPANLIHLNYDIDSGFEKQIKKIENYIYPALLGVKSKSDLDDLYEIRFVDLEAEEMELLQKEETHPAIGDRFQNSFSNYIILGGGFLTANATKIIMGTFPPPKENLKQGDDFFFYPSNKNQFWNIIDTINETEGLKFDKLKFTDNSTETLNSNIQRKAAFVLQRNWAFLDFFSKIKRRVLCSSKDIDLIEVENVVKSGTLYQYLNSNNSINQIVCTYQTAFQNLIENLKSDEIKIEEVNIGEKAFYYNNKQIKISLLPAPARSRIKSTDRILLYKKLLYNL